MQSRVALVACFFATVAIAGAGAVYRASTKPKTNGLGEAPETVLTVLPARETPPPIERPRQGTP